ncbi:MAG: hypothetical protein DMF85_10215 [Acidobacteria bacterium]|nr:MAG: hypothetical protein DMF85_10215 [Acidobacteriota bacterium]PYR74947.1 MAG: hypothetical protein DMF86_16825 [Acidobacteriota bacterium]
MRWRTVALLVVILFLCAGRATHVAAQAVPRLIADNRTPYYVDVYTWNGRGWIFANRVAPGTWTAFPNASDGSLWRGMFGQAIRDHRVEYIYDAGYGGYQDVWWIR